MKAPASGTDDPPRRAPARPGVRRWLVLLAAVLAMAWQGFVVRSHVHLELPDDWPQVHAASATGPAEAQAQIRAHAPPPLQARAPQHRGNHPAHCPLCEELAQSGHYLLPGAIALASPAVAVWRASVAVIASAVVAPAHRRWNSRAPPLALRTA